MAAYGLLTSCNTGPDPVLVTTERDTYTLPAVSSDFPLLRLTVVIRNEGQRAVYFDSCNDIVKTHYERLEFASWRRVRPVQLSCFGFGMIRGVTLPPGSTHESVAFITEPGAYRLEIPFGYERGNEAVHGVRSNVFEVG
jgi:hypothetical protein